MVSEIDKAIIRKAIGFLSINVEILKDVQKQSLVAMITSVETETEKKCFSYNINRYTKLKNLPVQNLKAVRGQLIEEIYTSLECNNGK